MRLMSNGLDLLLGNGRSRVFGHQPKESWFFPLWNATSFPSSYGWWTKSCTSGRTNSYIPSRSLFNIEWRKHVKHKKVEWPKSCITQTKHETTLNWGVRGVCAFRWPHALLYWCRISSINSSKGIKAKTRPEQLSEVLTQHPQTTWTTCRTKHKQ